MSEEDVGLPEESQNKLEQENAVPVEAVGPYTIESSTRQIFENIDDMYDYGTDIVYSRRARSSTSITLFIVVDNSDDANLLYPNQPNYWIGERLPPAPEYAGDDEDFRGDVSFWPLYEYSQLRAEEGGNALRQPAGSIIAGNYRSVQVYLPDPAIDYSRPESQTGDTTGETTGTTVRTTTTVTPGSAGGVTESETIPADITDDARSARTNASTTTSAVTGGRGTVVEQPGARAAASSQSQVTGGRGNGAAEVAQRQADAAVSSTTTADVQTGTTPCLPNNPPAASGTTESGASPPASVPYDDAILRQARAAAAAPTSTADTTDDARSARTNASSTASTSTADTTDDARSARTNASTTAPTTVTQPPSTPTSSSTSTPRPPNVYIYEPLTPGFDRYDVNTGKKVYTPNNGPSRNTNSQPVVPQSTPRVPPIDGGIPVGTTTAATGSLLRQRRDRERDPNRVGPQ